MAGELFLLSSVWFLFVVFWMETLSAWLFLCHLAHDHRAFFHGGGGAPRASVSDAIYPFHVRLR